MPPCPPPPVPKALLIVHTNINANIPHEFKNARYSRLSDWKRKKLHNNYFCWNIWIDAVHVEFKKEVVQEGGTLQNKKCTIFSTEQRERKIVHHIS